MPVIYVVIAVASLAVAMLLYLGKQRMLDREVLSRLRSDEEAARRHVLLQAVSEMQEIFLHASHEEEICSKVIGSLVALCAADHGVVMSTYSTPGGRCDVQLDCEFGVVETDGEVWPGGWLLKLATHYHRPTLLGVDELQDAQQHSAAQALATRQLLYLPMLDDGRRRISVVLSSADGRFAEDILVRMDALFKTCQNLFARHAAECSRQEVEGVLKSLVETTSGWTGDQYFRVLAEKLSVLTDMKYVLVGELQGGDTAVEGGRLQMLANWKGDRLVPVTAVDLGSGPLQQLIRTGYLCLVDDLAVRYPQFVHEHGYQGMQSFIGVALRSRAGDVIGILVACDDRPFYREHTIRPVMQIVAARCAAEIQRMRVESENEELISSNRKLLAHLVSVQEQERRYLANELHDELGQWLSAIQAEMHLINEYATAAADWGLVRQSVQAITRCTDALHDVTREMLTKLRPKLLDEVGLDAALGQLVQEWQIHHPETQLQYFTAGNLDGMVDDTNIAIYRIIQECLTNVAKHAQAGMVRIDLTVDAVMQRVYLDVCDDGRGLQHGGITTSGYGLVGIKERALALGGSVVLENYVDNRGAHVGVVLPLNIAEGGVNDDRNYSSIAG